jgi:hypothetical protein
MTILFECDGCGALLRDSPGNEPGSGLCGRGDGRDVFWCNDCTQAALAAVAGRRAEAVTDEDRIREAMTEATNNPGKLITR